MKKKIAIYASDSIEENKEIIKILESLGGKNKYNTGRACTSDCYYIGEDNTIMCSNIRHHYNNLIGYTLYTLREYKKEFMENKEVKIIPPEGYEIDKKNSTFEKIVFKKVEEKLTYKKVAEILFLNKDSYFIDVDGNIEDCKISYKEYCTNINIAPTRVQLQRLLAINKLMNVAYYLNNGWEPDWNNTNIYKYCLYYDSILKKILIDFNLNHLKTVVYFKTKELAQQAIEILGEETIKLALGVI